MCSAIAAPPAWRRRTLSFPSNAPCDDGAGVLELDVHATRDGVVVVIHDDTLERTTNGDGRGAAARLRGGPPLRRGLPLRGRRRTSVSRTRRASTVARRDPRSVSRDAPQHRDQASASRRSKQTVVDLLDRLRRPRSGPAGCRRRPRHEPHPRACARASRRVRRTARPTTFSNAVSAIVSPTMRRPLARCRSRRGPPASSWWCRRRSPLHIATGWRCTCGRSTTRPRWRGYSRSASTASCPITPAAGRGGAAARRSMSD